MNLQNGWDSVPDAEPGILLWKNLFWRRHLWGQIREGKWRIPVPRRKLRWRRTAEQETGIEELDRVLGGGIVGGSLTLVGGDPGIGKSTLLLQVCQKLAEKNRKVLYISGEESLRRLK